MKAMVARQFGGPEVLRLEEVPDLKPGKGQVLIRLKAAGINPVDAYILSGTYTRMPALPYTPGMDGAGLVEGLGEGVTSHKVGDRVYVESALTGTFAEFCLADHRSVHPLPSNATFAQGAALGVPYATAHRALFGKARAQKGEKVLVHGASGGVGTAAVQLAKDAGLKVLATAGTLEGLRQVKDQGADGTFNHKAPDYLAKILEATEGQGVDVILEMAAHVNLGKDLSLLSKKGRVVVIGSRGPVEVNPRDLMGRDGEVLGMTLFNVPLEEKGLIHQDLVRGLERGALKPVVGKEFLLSYASQAMARVLEPGAQGKIVLVP